jgi:hypothetical protein
MNDKIRHIHMGLHGGLDLPITYLFAGSEGAEGSAREDGKRDTVVVQREEADRSLAAKSGTHKVSFGSFKSWCVQMIETGFAHPPA